MSGATESTASARAGSPARAIVCAGGDETEYLRAGCGAVVLLLTREYETPGALALIALLSATFLVIAPRVPRFDGRTTFAGWLTNVMDGLGIANASIVAEAAYAADAMRFARDDAWRVHRVVLLAEAQDASSVAELLRRSSSASSIP